MIMFVVMTASIMSRYDFEDYQISVQGTLLASRVMISYINFNFNTVSMLFGANKIKV